MRYEPADALFLPGLEPAGSAPPAVAPRPKGVAPPDPPFRVEVTRSARRR